MFRGIGGNVEQASEWRVRTVLVAVVLLAISIACAFIGGDTLTLYQVKSQDIPVLVVLALAMALVPLRSPTWRLPARLPAWWMLALVGLGIAAALAWGAYAIFGNYPLSRDEHMVLFDMTVYDTGQLAVPLDPFWRPYARAMTPDFLLNATMPTGLVSAYLPVNAVLRLLLSKAADPTWFNPLLALVGGAALLDVARRTFGADTRAVCVVMLIYVLSAQMVVNAMTPFSMTGHMALNLVWLAAFLRGGRAGHSAAILTGFLATGFHQLVFHPLFVAPFLLWRLREGQWRLVLLYAAAYAAIILWWAFFPILASAQVASAAGAAGEDNFITERVLPLLLNRTPGTLGLMDLNLLRFCAWQNFALLPLLVAAVPVVLRQRGFAGVLALGILFWLAFLALVLPYQGLGWGFRYLSGYLGSFALLAGFGYQELRKGLGDKADGMVIVLSSLTAVLAIPLLLVSTHRFAEPFVKLDRVIAAQQTPFVLIDTAVTPATDRAFVLHPFNQVRNLPDLSNRPLRFSANQMDAGLLVDLCRRGPVTLITRANLKRAGLELNVPDPSPHFDALIDGARPSAPNCFRAAS